VPGREETATAIVDHPAGATDRENAGGTHVLVAIQPTRVRWLLWLFHKLVPRQTRSYEHMGFACASRAEVDERARLAREKGVRVLFPPTYVDERVGYIFEVIDPDNNSVEWTFGQSWK